MSETLQYITLSEYRGQNGTHYSNLRLSYQVFGPPLGESPIIWVGHALSGNSNVAHPKTGWWRHLIGENKAIDTQRYTVICFNVLGNGYGSNALDNYTQFTAGDHAELQFLALKSLGVHQLFAAIGGSIGGGILWELALAHPHFIQTMIPVACCWQSSAWVKSVSHVQHQILEQSPLPLETARQMAMLLYRTPQSFDSKFTDQNAPIEWLQYHGEALAKRFTVDAYKTMNFIMGTIHSELNIHQLKSKVKNLKSHVVQIAINSDILFHPQSNYESKKHLDALDISNDLHEIISLHGHDAFLIEYEQLTRIISPLFNYQK